MNPIPHINNPNRSQSMITDVLKICCLTSLGLASMSHFSCGSQVKAVIGINSAIRSIMSICAALMASGIFQIPHTNKLSNTAKSSPPFEATARIADFFIFWKMILHSLIAYTSVAKLSSSKTISEASLATSLPIFPIATPI